MHQFVSRRPIEERWREALPDIDQSTIGILWSACREIENFAYGLARQAHERASPTQMARDASQPVREGIAKEYPFLDGDSIRWAVNRAMIAALF